jgi:hypothetical protein
MNGVNLEQAYFSAIFAATTRGRMAFGTLKNESCLIWIPTPAPVAA